MQLQAESLSLKWPKLAAFLTRLGSERSGGFPCGSFTTPARRDSLLGLWVPVPSEGALVWALGTVCQPRGPHAWAWPGWARGAGRAPQAPRSARALPAPPHLCASGHVAALC